MEAKGQASKHQEAILEGIQALCAQLLKNQLSESRDNHSVANNEHEEEDDPHSNHENEKESKHNNSKVNEKILEDIQSHLHSLKHKVEL